MFQVSKIPSQTSRKTTSGKSAARPFQVVGVDFAGPIKYECQRKHKEKRMLRYLRVTYVEQSTWN